jgi:hypothetical protein
MPTAWLPWPGKVNATVIRLAHRTGLCFFSAPAPGLSAFR